MKKILILGGGVSGLLAAIILAKRKDFSVLLVDKKDYFLNSLRLHLTFQDPVKTFQKSYSELSSEFQFRFLQKEILLSEEILETWERDSFIEEIGESFDYLILSTGAAQISPNSLYISEDAPLLRLDDFMNDAWKLKMEQILSANTISFIGGGASSIQFLFELYAFLDRYQEKPKIHFYTLQNRLLSTLPPFFHEYVHSKFKYHNTEFFPLQKIDSITKESVRLESVESKTKRELPSDFTFLFPGVKPAPLQFITNGYGQILRKNYVSQKIFSAGDCSFFQSAGDNSLSAQIAVRKARIVSQNIISHSSKQNMKNFSYKELGYFISMGALDGIGWMLFPMNILFGPPAFVIKELIEKQFELFIKGVDTYIDF